MLTPGMPNRGKLVKDHEEDEDDVQNLINKGFSNYFNIMQTTLYDLVAPYVLCFLLSLTPQQQHFLSKCQPSDLPDAPLYFPSDFLSTFQGEQQALFARSQIWKLPRYLYLRAAQS